MSNEKEIKVTDFKDGSGAKIDIYSPDSRVNPHDSIHIKVNYNTKTYDAVTKIDGQKETSSGGCYLTSACMKHFQNEFDDNCYELRVLRWFRDSFVTEDDIKHYYETAPIIVASIDNDSNKDLIYDYIYDNVVDVCVEAIKNGDYEFAYNRYKSSLLSLEETFGRKELNKKLIKVLQEQI